MPAQPNRRKNHLFGYAFNIDVKWFLIIIVMGLVQFGTFWEQFRVFGTDIKAIKSAVEKGVNVGNALLLKDAQQDSRITEIERRLNTMDTLDMRTNRGRP